MWRTSHIVAEFGYQESLSAMKPPFTPPRHQFPSNTDMMRMLGFEPDPWQVEVLETSHKRMLLNCSRQAGKSTVVAVLGLVEALFNPLHKVVIVSRSLRQSKELFRVVRLFHRMLQERLKQRTTQQELELDNLSRIICLPCSEETIRGIAHVNLLIIDEAARVPDELYKAVRPMLAVSGGRMICLSTPCGKRGFFYEAWAKGGDDWLRISIPARRVPRISAEFLAEERRALGETWYRQEYECAFEAVQGLVFPHMAECVVAELPSHLAAARGPPPPPPPPRGGGGEGRTVAGAARSVGRKEMAGGVVGAAGARVARGRRFARRLGAGPAGRVAEGSGGIGRLVSQDAAVGGGELRHRFGGDAG